MVWVLLYPDKNKIDLLSKWYCCIEWESFYSGGKPEIRFKEEQGNTLRQIHQILLQWQVDGGLEHAGKLQIRLLDCDPGPYQMIIKYYY